MLRTRRRRASDDENDGRCLNVWEVFITTTIYVSWFWTALHRGVNNSNSRETRISSIITITNHMHIWVLSIFLWKRKLVSQLVNWGWIRKRRIHMTQCHCITQYFHTLDSSKMNKFFNKYFGFRLPALQMFVAKCLKFIRNHSGIIIGTYFNQFQGGLLPRPQEGSEAIFGLFWNFE